MRERSEQTKKIQSLEKFTAQVEQFFETTNLEDPEVFGICMNLAIEVMNRNNFCLHHAEDLLVKTLRFCAQHSDWLGGKCCCERSNDEDEEEV